MAIFSAYNIIRSVSVFHLTLAFFLIKNPKIIADQNIVFVLGESMHLPTPRDFSTPSAATAFIGMLFGFLALTDLTALSMSDEVTEQYWGTQTPVRLVFLFGLTGYTYLFKEGGLLASKGLEYTINSGDGLKNSLVFTWAFVEMVTWFWVYANLRDERQNRMTKVLEKRQNEEKSRL